MYVDLCWPRVLAAAGHYRDRFRNSCHGSASVALVYMRKNCQIFVLASHHALDHVHFWWRLLIALPPGFRKEFWVIMMMPWFNARLYSPVKSQSFHTTCSSTRTVAIIPAYSISHLETQFVYPLESRLENWLREKCYWKEEKNTQRTDHSIIVYRKTCKRSLQDWILRHVMIK